MVTNFDYLKNESKFSAFANVAISAEKIILADPDASILNSRRAMEFAVKWLYSVENSLQIPYQDNLHTLMNTEEFRQLVGPDLWKRMDYIRRCGNSVAHSNKKPGRDAAMLCLENLSIFLDYVAYCYGEQYQEHPFDKSIIDGRIEKAKVSRETARKAKETLLKEQEKTAQQELDLQKLMAENTFLREELSARHEKQQQTYVPKPLDLSEYETRKLYIDSMLIDAGWTQGKDWLNEMTVTGMPNKSGIGRIDYVLYDDMNKPLAIIEAKRTCKDIAEGRQQAKLYADLLEKKYERRPVIFLTNGFETRIIDGQYPERKCSVIYSKQDLEKWFNLLSMRTSLQNISVDKKIADRYYQEAAIKAVCQSFDEKNRRKALLVMATGSGKTRTVMALCKVLVDAGWVKNILFLADRNSLVTQAKRSFVNWMQDFSCTNLVEEKNNYMSRCVFSTYQTMINCIDTINDKEGKVFTSGHFDLIICDEAHRSIYNKYKDIFTYFDALLVGLTATPKDEIDKNTYEVFELANGDPTYGYDLAQAVKDGYLVDYLSVESRVKFIDQGIVYDELSEADKEIYENTFEDENGKLPEAINSAALNTWIFNEDTIKKILHVLMRDGIKIEYGQKIGKTIIFAKNHDHAEKILEIFNKEYPHLKNYASFTVRQHLKYVELYSEESNYQMLTYEDTLLVREEVAPLILPESDEVTAVRFDALMYGIELASLVGKKYTSARKDLLKKVSGIAGVANIPEIQAQTELINQILHTDYVENAGIDEFENIRENLRDLMKYIPDKSRNKYMTNFTDEILSTKWKEAELENDDLENYKVRVEYYVRQHQDNHVIAKLKKNQSLTEKDVAELEKILWSELGTKEDYEAEFGRKPLGEFVREMVGLDMNAAKEAFSKYLEDVNLDSRQIYFVNQIIEYIVHNGMMKDLSVLLESPFTDRGSISEIFTDMGVWLGIKKVIDTINANAAA